MAMGGFTALPMGTRLEHFVIDTVIGAGGFGITYIAKHDTLNKMFALKEYFPREFAYREGMTVRSTQTGANTFRWGLSRFLDEARALAKFKHPAIVDVAHVFEANGTAYMALAYEQGHTMAAWLRDLERLPTQAELDAIVRPVLDAMEVMHANGMLHRDIAPDNILVRDDGTPVLLDFGSARSDMKERAGPVTAIVKTGYSPQEQYQSLGEKQGPWSDIYAFAATLYRAVSGRAPMDAMDRVAAPTTMPAARTAPGGYRRSFLDAIDWGMSMSPTERPQSVAQWRARLLGDAPDAAETKVVPQPRPEPEYEPEGARGRPNPNQLPTPGPVRGSSRGKQIGLGLAAAFVAAAALYALVPRGDAGPAKTAPAPAPEKTATSAKSGTESTQGASAGTTTTGNTQQQTKSTGEAASRQVADSGGSAAAAIEVSIALPKTSFAIGDPFSFTMTANRDCNVLVFTVDANDKVELHDPKVEGAFLGPPLLKAGEVRQVPVPGAPGRAVVNPPAGAYQIGAVCTRDDLAKLGLSAPQLKAPAASGKRSFSFKIDEVAKTARRDEVGRVTVGYDVK